MGCRTSRYGHSNAGQWTDGYSGVGASKREIKGEVRFFLVFVASSSLCVFFFVVATRKLG